MEEMIHCQSCGMPLTEEAARGKNADGSKNEDYCCYCYADGAFVNPDETLEEMVTACVPFIVEDGVHAKDEESARKLLEAFLPTLKRWKKYGMIISFRVKDGVSDEALIAASDEIQEKYLAGCQGFRGRQLMRNGDIWTDWLVWETMADAVNSMHQSMENAAAQAFTALVGEVVEQNLYPLERVY